MNPLVPLDNTASDLEGTDRITLLVGMSCGHERPECGEKEGERVLRDRRVLVTSVGDQRY